MIDKNNFLKNSKNKTENRNSVCYPNKKDDFPHKKKKKIFFHCSDETGYTKEEEKNFNKIKIGS